MPMRIPRIVVLLSLVAVLAGSAGAQDRASDSLRDQGSRPIEVTADRLSADNARNTVTFEG
ncbi:MAG TPA: hypothetical protein VLB08_07160, partial [Candidatus Deferrimicrobium sp.]|nr:hypothetical protein [Candidatus Deferrimicrobium sp.]